MQLLYVSVHMILMWSKSHMLLRRRLKLCFSAYAAEKEKLHASAEEV